MDDTTLLELARSGDPDAYGQLVRRHMDVAQRVAWVITSSSAEAADAAQEGFVKAWIALPTFRAGAEFRPWLLRIVANCARNRVRASGRRRHLALRAAAQQPLVDIGSPEHAALSHERRDMLLLALNELAPADRAVLVCRYLLELSEVETAAALGWPRGTVKSRASRALRKLRGQLAATETTLEEAP